MNIETTKDSKFILLQVKEPNLTAVYAPALKAELLLLSKEKQNIILDLSELNYIDSAGLSCLLIADRLCKENKKIAVICNFNDKIENLIKLTKLDNVLTLVNSTTEAKDYILMNELEKEF